VIAGWSHRRVTLLYLRLAVLGVVLALAWVGGLPGGAPCCSGGALCASNTALLCLDWTGRCIAQESCRSVLFMRPLWYTQPDMPARQPIDSESKMTCL